MVLDEILESFVLIDSGSVSNLIGNHNVWFTLMLYSAIFTASNNLKINKYFLMFTKYVNCLYL